MPERTYNPDDVSFIWGAVAAEGYAAGVMIRVEWNQPQSNYHRGTKGESSRAVVRDRSGRITVRLASTSPTNVLFDAQALVDEVTGRGTYPAAIIDASGTTIFAADTVSLQQRPPREFSDQITEIEWVFEAAVLIGVHGGN